MQEANIIVRPDLGGSLDEIVHNALGDRGRAVAEEHLRDLRVAGACKTGVCEPFRGRLRRGAQAQAQARPMKVGQSSAIPTRGVADRVLNLIASLGGTPCRMWGAEPPGSAIDPAGCLNGRKVCGGIAPYNFSVTASADAESHILLAKKWFWPLAWVDASSQDVTLADVRFQGDSIFETSGSDFSFPVGSLLGPADNYGILPGLPAFDSKDGLEFLANNADAMSAENLQGFFVGVSIRN